MNITRRSLWKNLLVGTGLISAGMATFGMWSRKAVAKGDLTADLRSERYPAIGECLTVADWMPLDEPLNSPMNRKSCEAGLKRSAIKYSVVIGPMLGPRWARKNDGFKHPLTLGFANPKQMRLMIAEAKVIVHIERRTN